MKNKKKNFNIVRYFKNGKNCLCANFISKKEADRMMEMGIMPSKIANNSGGGKSVWFDLDIKPHPFEITEYQFED
jgi:hypothetical protein